MRSRSRRPRAVELRPRIRVTERGEILMGPGKADLLEAIRDTGSIRDAAARLEMSYMRAWGLVRTMNAAFSRPLVQAARGGARHGGASLTQTGLKALALYREMEAASIRSMSPAWTRLRRLLRG